MAAAKKAAAPAVRVAAEGFVLFRAGSQVVAVSVGGVSYPVDATGIVEIPAEFAGELPPHGFALVEPEPAAEA